jgi:hypothetical protein
MEELRRANMAAVTVATVIAMGASVFVGTLLPKKQYIPCYDNCPCAYNQSTRLPPESLNPMDQAMRKIKEGEDAKKYLRTVDEQLNGPRRPEIDQCEKDCNWTWQDCDQGCQSK